MGKPLTLGFGMQGLGDQVANYVHALCERFSKITYLEIGVGHGTTLAGIAGILRRHGPWRAIGIDMPDGYSLDKEQVRKTMAQRNLPYTQGKMSDTPLDWGIVTLLLEDSQECLKTWGEIVNLVLIDGCHGKPCAMNDFLHIEKHVVPGGIVMFHDFGEDQQWQPQPHCPEGIDVRGACRDLGLLDNDRPGWRFMETLVGDKQAGSGDMGVFEKL